MENNIKVNYYNEDILIESKYLLWPQKYEDLIQDIIQNFQLINKNIKVELKLITNEDDIINIYSQNNLGFICDNKIKEFKFFVVDNKNSDGSKHDMSIRELDKLLDPNLIKEEEDFDIDNIIKEMFDVDGYKQKKKEEEIKYFYSFKKDFEKNVEDLFSKNSKIMEEKINKKLFNYERLFNEELKEAYNFLLDIKDNLLDINDYILDLWISIKELCDQIKNINCAIRDIKQTKGLKEEKLEHNLNPLSNLFEEEEDPIKQKQKRAAKIYEELKNEFHENENLLNEKEIINQLLENDLNKNEIEKSLNSKIQQIQENQKNEKAKQLYKELSFYDYNHDFNENEVIALIKEENFNKENVQKCINEKIAENIYDIISKLDEVDITKNNPKEVKKKIIGLNFNIDKIKETFKKIIIKENSSINPDLNHNNDDIDDDNKNHYIYGYDDEEEIDKILQRFEDEYGVSGFIEEDAFKEKMREFNLNIDQIIDWIENNLLSGDD